MGCSSDLLNQTLMLIPASVSRQQLQGIRRKPSEPWCQNTPFGPELPELTNESPTSCTRELCENP